MSGDQVVGALFVLLAMTLVASSLATRQLPMPRMALLGLTWAGIFLLAIAIAAALARGT